MEKPAIDLMIVGDLLLGAPEAEPYFDKVRDVFARADVVIGQVEWPHTKRGQVCAVEMPAPAADPNHLKAVKNAGFDIATLSSNHIFDQGPYGVLDTVDGLKELGIATVGAGANLDEARKPAIIERNGIKVGVLAYNCAGPRESWATPLKAGAAHIQILSHYELEYASPGSKPADFSFPHPDQLEAMRNDVRDLKRKVDVVAVVLHKGLVRIPIKLAEYERQVCRAAIDSGADLVVGHHAHVLRGVEIYNGRPIYHGVNHFVATYAPPEKATVATGGINMHDRSVFKKAWREPPPSDRDPGSNFRYPAEARNTMIAALKVTKDGVETAGFVPCWINLQEQPEPFGKDDARGMEVASYVKDITRAIGSDVEFSWQGDRVVFFDRKKGS